MTLRSPSHPANVLDCRHRQGNIYPSSWQTIRNSLLYSVTLSQARARVPFYAWQSIPSLKRHWRPWKHDDDSAEARDTVEPRGDTMEAPWRHVEHHDCTNEAPWRHNGSTVTTPWKPWLHHGSTITTPRIHRGRAAL